jgi:prefoldin subunit 5
MENKIGTAIISLEEYQNLKTCEKAIEDRKNIMVNFGFNNYEKVYILNDNEIINKLENNISELKESNENLRNEITKLIRIKKPLFKLWH